MSEPTRSSLPYVMALVADVEGWMTPGQAATLYDSAVNCAAGGRIVEIGSFQGRSTIVLASAADPSVDVIAIDPHAGTDRGPQEIDGFANEA
ncbi:MAG: putative O-methyltransferase YrrM, partial [Halioglobus sp.]